MLIIDSFISLSLQQCCKTRKTKSLDVLALKLDNSLFVCVPTLANQTRSSFINRKTKPNRVITWFLSKRHRWSAVWVQWRRSNTVNDQICWDFPLELQHMSFVVCKSHQKRISWVYHSDNTHQHVSVWGWCCVNLSLGRSQRNTTWGVLCFYNLWK